MAERFRQNIEVKKYVSDRILILSVTINSLSILFINVYFIASSM